MALLVGQSSNEAQPRASKRFGTVVCDGERCVIGNYKPLPSKGMTAHLRLAKAAGMENPKVAGSIKGKADPERGQRRGDISLRSESVNRSTLRTCDAVNTPLGDWAQMKMALGEVESVKEYRMTTRSSTKAKVDHPTAHSTSSSSNRQSGRPASTGRTASSTSSSAAISTSSRTASRTASSTSSRTASSQQGARGTRSYVDNAANRKAMRVGIAY